MSGISEVGLQQQTSEVYGEFEPTNKDFIAEKVQRVATHLMRLFWFGEECYHLLFTNPLPLAKVSKVVEVAKRLLIGISCIPTYAIGIPLLITAHFFTAGANFISARGYTLWKGDGPNNTNTETKVLHLNTCMLPGGLPITFGGQTPASFRTDRLIECIKKENPDILCLCEVSRLLSDSLYAGLKDLYPRFFVDVGLKGGGMESALFLACRDAVLTPPIFVPFQTPNEGEQKFMQRGAFIFETQKCWYIYTHLHTKDSKKADQIRRSQLNEVMEEIKKRSKGNKPFLLLGDLNIDQYSKPQEYQEMIHRGFHDSQGNSEAPLTKHPCTKHPCMDQKKGRIDYALVFPSDAQISLKADLLDTGLSDHFAIKLKVDRPNEDRLKVDRPNEDRLKVDRPNEDRLKVDRPNEDRLKVDRPNEDRLKVDRPNEDRPNEDRLKVEPSSDFLTVIDPSSLETKRKRENK